MAQERTIQNEVSSFISSFFRQHFGKGPTSVYVTFEFPFIVIHLRGFLTPMEENLMNQNESKRVMGTRLLMMGDMEKEIVRNLKDITGIEIKELYADWDIEAKTGVIWGVMESDVEEEAVEWPEHLSKENFVEKINRASQRAEKVPEHTGAYWLNDRTVLVRRVGILMAIEKELIKNGFVEELKISKRPLEQRVLKEVEIESALSCKVNEVFLDWNFEKDLGYLIFILEPPRR